MRSPSIDAPHPVRRSPRLIVTRPLAQATSWVKRLQALGCDAQALPLIQIAALEDTSPLQRRWRELGGAVAGVTRPQLVMFVSANAVQHFFAAALAPHAAWPDDTLAGATGPGTAAALMRAGVTPAAIVEPAPDAPTLDSEALWQQLQKRVPDWRGLPVWVVRGGEGAQGEGRDWFAQTLTEHGARVDRVSAYRRSAPQLDGNGHRLLQEALRWPDRHVWLFSSSEAVGHLMALVAQEGNRLPDTVAPSWRDSRAWASHPRIMQAALRAGFGDVQVMGTTPEAVAQQWSRL